MDQESVDYEQRANEVGDSIRTHLVAFHTGGIATLLATAASFLGNGVAPQWIVIPTASFSLGLIVVLCSLFLQKYKAIQRSKAIRAKKEVPSYEKWRWRNFTWDIVSVFLFVIAVWLSLSALQVIQLPVPCPK